MKKISTVATKQIRNFSQPKLTIGLDLGDRSSWYCLLDEVGEVLQEQKLGTTPKAMREVFGGMPRSRMALETGMHSPWVSRLLRELGHEVIVAHARNVRLIGESRKKDDRLDAQNAGAAGANRSAVAVSGEASQRESASGLDGDPSTSGTGASADGAGEHRSRTGEELRRATAWVQRAQYESGESGRTESGVASGAGAVAGGTGIAQ